MLFNSIFGRKNSTSSTTSKGVKLNKKNHQPRRMVVEPLESRDLLTVTTGAIDNAAYDEIRATYPEFNLPVSMADQNVISLNLALGDGLEELKSALLTAGTTTKSDLIVVHTSSTANTIKYTSSSDELIINIDSTQYGSVSIIGMGEKNLTLDANQLCRVMTISGSSTIVDLVGLTIQNGTTSNDGAGIHNSGKLSITDCTIKGNSTTGWDSYGGGIYNSNATLTISNSVISGNTAYGYSGGGICNNGGSLTVLSCDIFGNSNGVSNHSGTATIRSSTISGNTDASGVRNWGEAIITDCKITGNQSLHDSSGGGISSSNSLILTNCEISGNTATRHGGGIYNEGTATITNCTIERNRAISSYTQGCGGGICNYAFNSNSNLTITNSTISNNSASNRGGGIYNYAGNSKANLTVTNCTIVSNSTAQIGGGIRTDGATTKIYNSIVIFNYDSHLDCWDELSASYYAVEDFHNILSTSGDNIDVFKYDSSKPLFVDADNGDYHLIAGSQAINKGNNQYAINAGLDESSTDFDGNSRIVGNAIDLGVYEFPWDCTVVNTLNDSFDLNDDEWSLREAVYCASGYVTITFADELEGSIVLTQGQLEINSPLTIDGDNRITIDADQKSRAFYISAGTEEKPVVLNGLTIQNGYEETGGGIYNNYGTLSISASTISGNMANNNGGGIFNNYGTLSISANTISDNTASSGGGIYNNSGTITISASTISDNTAFYGGGIYNQGTLTVTNSTITENTDSIPENTDSGTNSYGGGIFSNGSLTISSSTLSDNTASKGGAIFIRGMLTVTNSTISRNTASDYGGGIYNNSGTVSINNSEISSNTADSVFGGGICSYGTLTITDSEILDNKANTYYGGGIYQDSGTLTVTNSVISGNTANSYGGGIYNYGTLTVTNSMISGNTSSSYGGGFFNNSGTLTVTNSVISGNTANSYGGGIYNYGTLTVTNSTISGNTASSIGGGIYNNINGTLNVYNSIVSYNYNSNVYGKLSDNSANNLIGYFTGFVCPPVFDSDGKLTNADTMNLHLRSDSIALDKGNNSAVENIDKDIEGKARIYGEIVDIGAYEHQGDGNDEPISYSAVVNTLNDSFDLDDDEWSLREAIYYAPEYVTISFSDELEGIIVLTQGQLEIDKALAINGDNRISIDADQKSRAFYVSGGTEESPVVLNGLIIQNGKASYGGGIYNNGGTLTITNSTISGNTITGTNNHSGGGIYNPYGTLTIINSTISGNKSSANSSFGGGIENVSTLTIINSTISDNTAWRGGGISNRGTLTITNSTISGNKANADGGGIFNSHGKLTITNSTISGNSASGNNSSAGGICNYGTLTITSSTISRNTASYGGGICNYSGTLTITDSTISGNTAQYYGSGFCNYGTLTITNSTISSNKLSSYNSYGSGIYNGGTLTITNSTIAGNMASAINSYCGGIYNNDYGTLYVYNSIVSLNFGGNVYGELSDNSANNIIDYYPGFVCAPAFDYDGTLTNADTMDLHLRRDSNAINMGNNSAVDNIYNDIEGNARIYGDIVDIGAFEYQGDRNDEPFSYSTVVNTLNDSFDLYDDEWSLREAIYYAPEYVTITFEDELEGTIVLTLGQLNMEAPLAIDGDNRITIDADKNSRIFFVSCGREEAPVILNGLTIQNGYIEVDGGGIYNNYGTLTITNSAILGNTSECNGGGIYNYSGTLTITNSTISSNTASGTYSYGGGIYNKGAANVYNSIIVNNIVQDDSDINSKENINGYNNLSTYNAWEGSDNIEYDPNSPLFVNAANGDYRLADGSQAIDKGNNQYAIDAGLDESSTDLAGKSRFVGEAIDIGAYEYPALEALAVPTLNTPTANGQTISVSWNSVPNADGYLLEYQLSTDSAWTTVFVSGTSATFIGDPGMTYNIRVKAKGSGNYSNSDYSEVKSVYVNNEQVTDDASCLRAFMELTDEDGVKNGEKINSAYDANDTSTWTGVTWSEIDGVMRVTAIDWCDMQLVGELDLSQCSALEELYCISNLLTAINVSGCTALTSLWCGDNLLTALDVSNNPALDYLNCCINQISSLDVTKNVVLGFLDCGDNQLTSLNVSSNLFLWQLNCDCNQLTSLDVSNNIYLSQLRCHVNQLTALDVSNNPELWHLDCRYNNLTQLDLSNNSQLMEFYCNSNNLTSLDVSNNPELKWFGCSNNQLTLLDVSNNPELSTLGCWNSGLKSVIINPLTEKVSISLDFNRWTFLDANDNALAENASGFDYSASDSAALPITAFNSYDDQTILITDVIPVDILTVQNDFVKTTLNNPVVIDYRENDTVTDWSATTVYFGDASFGEYAVNADGTITYTPEDGFYGTDAVSYVVVGSSGELATGAIVISVGLPIATSVQTTSGSHSPTSAMAPSVPAVTDWDDCYVELWAQGVNELNPGETTLTLEYNPAVYCAPTFSACADGVALTVSQSSVLPNGNVLVELTAQVSEPLASQTDNLFLGTVVLTPSMAEGSGVDGSAVPVIGLDGSESPTTVESMPYDLIRNGAVDVNDFVAFATVYGNAPESLSPDNPLYAQTAKADFNNDGIVNVADFILFAINYGATKKTADNPTAQGALQVKSEYIAEEIVNEEFVIQIADPDNSVQETSNSQLITLNSQPEVESSMTLLQAYSSALLDLYDNQNEQLQPSSELSAPAIDAALYQDDEFDFLFDETDSDSSDSSDVDLSVVLDELELEFA